MEKQMALENFGFTNNGINQKVLQELCLRNHRPSTGFLRAAYCGFKAPLDVLLLEQMNPAEILGVSAGFFITARTEKGQEDRSDWRPAFLYATMQERAQKHYGLELGRIDDISHERKVRPYTSDLHDRLSSVKLSDEKRKKIMAGSVEYEHDISMSIHDPANGLGSTNNAMKLYIKNLFRDISSKYSRYLSEQAKAPSVDSLIQPPGVQS